MTAPLFQSSITSLPLLSKGKVRDIYAVGDDQLLIVTTDRLSAFDVILPDPIPRKGEVLTAVADFWFRKLGHIVPNQLTGIDPGFDAKSVLTFRLVLPSIKYPEFPPRSQFFQKVTERLKALPDVKSVGITSYLPFGGPSAGTAFHIFGQPDPPPGQDRITNVFVVDNGVARVRMVTTGRRREADVEVLTGLTEGENVISPRSAAVRKLNELPIGWLAPWPLRSQVTMR